MGGWKALPSVCLLAGLAVSLLRLGCGEMRVVTVCCLTLALAKHWFVVNLGDRVTLPWRNDILANPAIRLAWLVCILLLLTAVYRGHLAVDRLLRTRTKNCGMGARIW